jgi:hypothetical protein
MSTLAQVLPFDWRNPDYAPVYQERAARLARLRARPDLMPSLRTHYREHPAQFISDWGSIVEPRNVERGLDAVIPFVLFPKQVELIEWIMARWRAGEHGLVEKSRDSGASFLTVALGCTLCLFHTGMAIGFGSRKEEYVDQRGAPKALLEKVRNFMSALPPEWRNGWDRDRDAPHMRVLFRSTGSVITGECGDMIGRGDRTSLYFVDEAAFLDRPDLVDASLSATTNCRIDVSTPNGMANSFAAKRFGGKHKVFTLHWRDDPRKDEAWFKKQCEQLDPVTLSQEVSIDFKASIEGTLIAAAWIESAVGALERLGLKPSGDRCAALDIADEGRDRNAFAARYGQQLEFLHSCSGASRDIFDSVERAFLHCDERGYRSFRYDADGMGAGVRGDARVINERRKAQGARWIDDTAYRGSAAPLDPEGELVPGRKNKDFFANLKAQSWWALRARFQATHRAVVEGAQFDPDEIISIAPDLPELQQLIQELGQPTFSINGAGKVAIDKAPQGFKSPNLADAVCMVFAPQYSGHFFPEYLLLTRVP